MANQHRATSFSGIGKRQKNEDSLFPDPYRISEISFPGLYMVCDGMGGHVKGEVASELICRYFPEYFVKNNIAHIDSENIREALAFVEEKFDDYLADHQSAMGMGSTFCLLNVYRDGATVAHVGDSRVYQFRGGDIIFKTKDHSKVQMLRDAGVLKTDEEARNHHERSVLMQAVLGASVQSAKPSTKIITDLEVGDVFLLCTDGVTEAFDDGQLQALFQERKTIEKISENIVNVCQERSSDNFSFYLVEILQPMPSRTETNLDKKETPIQESTRQNSISRFWLIGLLTMMMLAMVYFVFNNENKSQNPPIVSTKILPNKSESTSAPVIQKTLAKISADLDRNDTRSAKQKIVQPQGENLDKGTQKELYLLILRHNELARK